MLSRLTQLYEALGPRDVVQIVILAAVVFAFLRLLSKTGGSSISRGLGLVVVGLFFFLQVVIASLDLTELSTVLDYLLITVVIALLIIFQPELRRGLMVLGRSKIWRTFKPEPHALADPLADAAEAMSREYVGALVAIQREVSLTPYIESGERIEARCSAALVRSLFVPRGPLHDGAAIVSNGQIVAAGCQLPLRRHDHFADKVDLALGMRHRAALSLSEETDAIVLVVSEETGRISLALGGKFEAVPRENLARRLAALLAATPAA